MNEIKCPHCGEAFKIDEAGYAEILSQVRDDASTKPCTNGWNSPSRKRRPLWSSPRSRPPKG